MVSLHFSLENAAFHTESIEIAKAAACTETRRMKKEDEKFGHSTSVFYLPMVSSIFEGLVPNMKARIV